MNAYEFDALAQATIEDRIREANHRRVAREFRLRERATAPTAVRKPRRHSQLWSVVHFRHAYN
jgi:hypothetical protein